MKTALFLLLALGMVLTGCGKKPATTAAANPTNSTASSGNPITAPVDYLGAVAAAKKYSEKSIDLAQLTHTIQQFYYSEDRYPTDLNEMVRMRYLAAVPTAPYGMQIEYNPQNGQVRIVPKQ